MQVDVEFSRSLLFCFFFSSNYNLRQAFDFFCDNSFGNFTVLFCIYFVVVAATALLLFLCSTHSI